MNTVTLKTAVFTATAAVVTLIAAFAVTVPAFATVRSGDEYEKIHYSDLDLATAEGAQHLLSRLSHAARDLCTHHEDPLWRAQRHGQCYEGTLADAVNEIGSPKLTAEYHRHLAGSAQRVSAVSRGSTPRVG